MSSTPSPCSGDVNNDGNNDPSMYLTVNSPSGNLPITWCDYHWVLSGADASQKQVNNGDSVEVCPDTYTLKSDHDASNKESWLNGTTGSHRQLALFRTYYQSPFGDPETAVTAKHRGIQLTNQGSDYFHGGNSIQCDLSVCCSGDMGTSWGSYRILKAQFGNYTDGNGVNYKWERGNGW